MLSRVGAASLSVITAGTVLYRGRNSDTGKRFLNANQLGPPPRKSVMLPNRMSRVGVVMFYGSFDEKTAIAEIHDVGETISFTSIGEFVLQRDIPVLELATVPRVPSIFDANERHRRPDIAFLRYLAHEIARPIQRKLDGQAEYAPTQFATEYFRDSFHTADGRGAMGICYRSSRKGCGNNVVLFVTAAGVGNDDDPAEIRNGKILLLNRQSIKYVDAV
jgi:hypothetical protein